MGIFSKEKLKVRFENNDDGLSFYIDYNKIKASEAFLQDLIEKISTERHCLMVIDTQMTCVSGGNTEKQFNRITDLLDKNNIKYKVLIEKRNSSITLFGATINQSEKPKTEFRIIGTIIELSKIKEIKQVLSAYYVYYYFSYDDNAIMNEILDKFEDNHTYEKLSNIFKYGLIDSDFLKQVVIKTASENINYINEILDGLKKQ